jgi:predicted RecB family nuclease
MTHLISTELFAAFLNCKYKAYLKVTGVTGSVSEYEIMETSLEEEYRRRASRHLLQSVPRECVVESPKSIHRAVQQEFLAITNARVAADGFSVRIDALLLSSAKTASRHNYLPIMFTASERVSKQHKLLLAFQAVALATILGHPPRYGRVVYGGAFHDVRVNIDRLRSTVEAHLDELREMMAPQFRLNDHCRVCEFGAHCKQLAIEKDDLSLLRRMSAKEISKLNNKGIFTTTQLSYTFRPRRRRKARTPRPVQHNHALQALAIRTETIYVAQKPELPKAQSLVYVDFEGVPNREFYYLIGVHVVTGRDKQFFSLWADTIGGEEKMWESFLGIIKRLGEFAVLHYGAYDRRAFELLSQRYGGDEPLIQMLIGSCTNVLSLIYGHVYFPTHSNDLKSIASCLGFQWSEVDASGLQSLVWRHHWDTDRDKSSKDKLLTYNREDCLALRTVTDALSAISESRSVPSGEAPRDTVNTDQLARGWPNTYGRNKFFLPELDRINRCAYFDYQRDRVFVRTSRVIRDAVRRKRRKEAKSRVKVNRTVEHPRPSQCPHCSHAKVIRHESGKSKTILDLKLFDGGIRRWVVKHVAHRYRCTECRQSFMPQTYPSTTYGNVLRAWTVHQNIGLLRSHNNIIEGMRELFGSQYPYGLAQRFKMDAARFYEPTYRMLLERIRTGHLAHVDETKVSAKGETRYVWVFTNLDEVAYVYSDTRERVTLDKVLDGFTGVLVSDFYPAYDSIDCPQQKCLIHLIRDINDDLFKNPFDEELKNLGAAFTALLVPIIETVDRYGLKKRHLNKHRADVARYFKRLSKAKLSSELAMKYKRRFVKNQHKLFTFLEHDGVPWNNNNAENAVKRFAFLRRMIGGSSTKSGLQEYLILLSIRETLRRKNISFFKFLRDGRIDLAAFEAEQ